MISQVAYFRLFNWFMDIILGEALISGTSKEKKLQKVPFEKSGCTMLETVKDRFLGNFYDNNLLQPSIIYEGKSSDTD